MGRRLPVLLFTATGFAFFACGSETGSSHSDAPVARDAAERDSTFSGDAHDASVALDASLSDSGQGDVASATCRSSLPPSGMEGVSGSSVEVALDLPAGANRDRLSADLKALLGKLWKTPVSVTLGPPSTSASPLIWISRSAAAQSAAGAPGPGYVLRRTDDGRPRIIVSAGSDDLLTRGTYALLETFGIRFFHPMQQYVPEWGGVHWPKVLNEKTQSAFAVRGTQLHTLHPIEYFAPFLQPSAQNLDLAKRFIDWLVKTGQNHVQWYLLKDIDMGTWRPHGKAIMEYAHARGVTVGVVVQIWKDPRCKNL